MIKYFDESKFGTSGGVKGFNPIICEFNKYVESFAVDADIIL
jgi:hypothetical protein